MVICNLHCWYSCKILRDPWIPKGTVPRYGKEEELEIRIRKASGSAELALQTLGMGAFDPAQGFFDRSLMDQLRLDSSNEARQPACEAGMGPTSDEGMGPRKEQQVGLLTAGSSFTSRLAPVWDHIPYKQDRQL